jgi:hypothetical protein
LDAATGQFRGFFQPAAADSYRPANDLDVDMPSSPVLFTRAGSRIVGIGSKNGSFFLLDPDTMARLGARQLLPYRADDPSQPLDSVDPGPRATPGENHSGMYGAAAVDSVRGLLFAGLGGWEDATDPSIDSATTPFLRAVRWDNTLADAWPTAVGADGVRRYTTGSPPLYSTPYEIAVGSPAVANDVVFVATSKPGIYAFDTATGVLLWEATNLPSPLPFQGYTLGPAIAGNNVVFGWGSSLYIYQLPTSPIKPPHSPTCDRLAAEAKGLEAKIDFWETRLQQTIDPGTRQQIATTIADLNEELQGVRQDQMDNGCV